MDQLSVNTIRLLSADMVQKANSGHPGLPMGIAPAAYTLWAKHLRHNPVNPEWPGRDRFVLSAGHGSALLYSLLHLFGYGLSIDDLKQFRQRASLTPGHPEYGHTRGVEVSTGPLGQGIANAVGFAMAEAHLAARFNKGANKLIDNYTYVLCGDGCLMEGISAEAASLAGTLALNKLILLYDSNNITIEGGTDLAFADNVGQKFRAMNWNYILVEDGNDMEAIDSALTDAKESDKPTIIEVKTQIGYGSPNKQGKNSAHGEPLGKDELRLTKKNLNWDYEEDFYVPAEVRAHFEKIIKSCSEKAEAWENERRAYQAAEPENYEEYLRWTSGKLTEEILNDEDFFKGAGDIATRISSEIVLNRLAAHLPNLIGGSADLSPSNKSVMKGREYFSKERPEGSNIHFGIREHAMAAIASGMRLYGGLIPYTAGFFVFSDYMKPALRMAALMKINVINIFTHDSIGVGEDGPTHQPVEQLAAIRSIPGVVDFRPCDTRETAAAWYSAVSDTESPYALMFTRQALKELDGTGKAALRGGYVLRDSEAAELLLIATGSEVAPACEAYEKLKEKGISARVVSMPSFALFERQSEEYKNSVIPPEIRKRIAIEAGSSFGWHKYTGLDGRIISVEGFGKSEPFEKLYADLGFTAENIVNTAEEMLGK